MKSKGLGLVLGVMLLFGTVNVGEATATKVSNEDVVKDETVLKPLRLLSLEASNSIKTVYEREISKRTVVSKEIWFKRMASNSIKSIQEKELSVRTAVPVENEGDDEVEEVAD